MKELENARACRKCKSIVLETDDGYDDRLCDEHWEIKQREDRERQALDRQRAERLAEAGREELIFTHKRRERFSRSKTAELLTDEGKEALRIARGRRGRKSEKDFVILFPIPRSRICAYCGRGPLDSDRQWYRTQLFCCCLSCIRDSAKREIISNVLGIPLRPRKTPSHYGTGAIHTRKALIPEDKHCPICSRGPLLSGNMWRYHDDHVMCQKCNYAVLKLLKWEKELC